MNLVPMGVSRAVATQMMTAKKNSPHIFFAGGVIGIVGSTFLACRATLKLEDTVDDIHNQITVRKDAGVWDDRSVRTKVYLNASKEVGKLYGPSILLGAVSIAALTGSHIQLTRRNAALTATLTATMKAYEEYRVRVQEELGKVKELELYHGVTEEKETNGKKVKYIRPGDLSPYAALFDETTTYNWEPSAENNRFFIDCQERVANQKLQSKGYVLLNDVLDMLGLDRTTAGSVVGWCLNSRTGESRGDGYITLGTYLARNKDFVDGNEMSIWLDFNVDGVVNDLIDKL